MTSPKAHVPACAASDAAAHFDATFLAHWQTIYRALCRLVGDASEAEDLALETFWRLHQRAPSTEQNLGGWLYRVAMNLGLNALRARQRRVRHELAAGKWELENATADPEHAVIAADERARMRAVLSEMSEREAHLLILRYSGMAYQEIARTLGVSPNSVGTLLARAEREFEKRFRQKEEG